MSRVALLVNPSAGRGAGGIIGFIPHVLRGTHVGRDGVTMARTRRLVVETDEPLVVHADGEIIDQRRSGSRWRCWWRPC